MYKKYKKFDTKKRIPIDSINKKYKSFDIKKNDYGMIESYKKNYENINIKYVKNLMYEKLLKKKMPDYDLIDLSMPLIINKNIDNEYSKERNYLMKVPYDSIEFTGYDNKQIIIYIDEDEYKKLSTDNDIFVYLTEKINGKNIYYIEKRTPHYDMIMNFLNNKYNKMNKFLSDRTTFKGGSLDEDRFKNLSLNNYLSLYDKYSIKNKKPKLPIGQCNYKGCKLESVKGKNYCEKHLQEWNKTREIINENIYEQYSRLTYLYTNEKTLIKYHTKLHNKIIARENDAIKFHQVPDINHIKTLNYFYNDIQLIERLIYIFTNNSNNIKLKKNYIDYEIEKDFLSKIKNNIIDIMHIILFLILDKKSFSIS